MQANVLSISILSNRLFGWESCFRKHQVQNRGARTRLRVIFLFLWAFKIATGGLSHTLAHYSKRYFRDSLPAPAWMERGISHLSLGADRVSAQSSHCEMCFFFCERRAREDRWHCGYKAVNISDKLRQFIMRVHDNKTLHLSAITFLSPGTLSLRREGLISRACSSQPKAAAAVGRGSLCANVCVCTIV